MNKKTWVVFIIICIVILGGLVFLSQRGRVDVSNINQNKIIPASQQNGEIADHAKGNLKSPVIFVEYGDYQCPYCGEAYPQVKKVTTKYLGQITYIFRNFPLTTLHPNALAAAAAAEAAGIEGKYWQMHDLLYENQNDWANDSSSQRTSTFDNYAKQIGLNETTFNNDMNSQRVQQKINFDRAIGSKVGVTGTPTFFLDGKQVSQTVAQSAISGDGSALDAAIASALKAHNIALPKS
ncbi:MAG TPA: thioredoxin domain-containing protein [Candidatus Saccharimonadaceae bacterium]|nr:thioredoxin domain-containing protein [Candidatus Saccharimonadaceae bacterium]